MSNNLNKFDLYAEDRGFDVEATPVLPIGSEQIAASPSLEAATAKPVWSLDQIVANFDAIHIGWLEGPVIYSFRESLSAEHELSSVFTPFSETERTFTRMALQLISDITNLTFSEAPDDGSIELDSGRIAFGNAAAGTAWAGVTGRSSDAGTAEQRGGISGAEVFMNSDVTSVRSWIVSGYNFKVLMHEVLHALGLPHPGDYNGAGASYDTDAEYAQDTAQYTVMSYFEAFNSDADHMADFNGQLATWRAATPLLHDVAALQAVYGANSTTRTGDTVYGFNANAGRDSLDFTINTHPIVCLWDSGGKDTLDLSGSDLACRLDLRQGAFSDAMEFTRNISIAFGTVIENATGGSAGDWLLGNAARNTLEGLSGRDSLTGAAGSDKLIGGSGADQLRGGSDADAFLFEATADSKTKINARDLILDLTDSDTIDLSAIDADSMSDGDQAFAVVTGGFKAAGQIRLEWHADAGETLLYVNIDADKQAEMIVRIAGDHHDFSNFIL